MTLLTDLHVVLTLSRSDRVRLLVCRALDHGVETWLALFSEQRRLSLLAAQDGAPLASLPFDGRDLIEIAKSLIERADSDSWRARKFWDFQHLENMYEHSSARPQPKDGGTLYWVESNYTHPPLLDPAAPPFFLVRGISVVIVRREKASPPECLMVVYAKCATRENYRGVGQWLVLRVGDDTMSLLSSIDGSVLATCDVEGRSLQAAAEELIGLVGGETSLPLASSLWRVDGWMHRAFARPPDRPEPIVGHASSQIVKHALLSDKLRRTPVEGGRRHRQPPPTVTDAQVMLTAEVAHGGPHPQIMLIRARVDGARLWIAVVARYEQFFLLEFDDYIHLGANCYGSGRDVLDAIPDLLRMARGRRWHLNGFEESVFVLEMYIATLRQAGVTVLKHLGPPKFPMTSKPIGGRPRVHDDDAAKQRNYRDRKRGCPPIERQKVYSSAAERAKQWRERQKLKKQEQAAADNKDTAGNNRST